MGSDVCPPGGGRFGQVPIHPLKIALLRAVVKRGCWKKMEVPSGPVI